MPVENPGPPVPEQPRDDWQQLARDAAGHQGPWNLEHPGVAALYENHVVPKLHDKGLGHLAITAEDKAGGRFLHKYGNVEQQEVDQVVSYLRQNGETIPDKAGDRTATYLNFMADTVNDGILTGDPESVKRQIDAHVIKAKDVPESYFALQRRIAREQGHGDIEITPDMKRQLIEAAQADQRGSLEKWVEYLGGDDGSYPDWFKRYTWDSVVKLGAYDKEKAKFDRRDSTTVAPYPELNREALAYVFDTVNKFHVLGDQQVDDAQLKQLLKDASFGRLYAHAAEATAPDNPELRYDTRGSWKKYNQTNDPRIARHLSGSLQGHGTGWCTAGESTAASQLGMGDFYVYYTRDEDGKDKVPRIAIRMQNGEVAEVRGVNPAQELEPVMADIASEQLEGLPGGEQYIQRAADMKRLTDIYNILSDNPYAQLNQEDVEFLFELDRDIVGFGYEDDPRVKDLQIIYQLGHPEIPGIDKDGMPLINPNRKGVFELIPRVLEVQYQTALEAYKAIARGLGTETVDTTQIQHEFSAKLALWQEQGVYKYMVEQLMEHDTRFSLVITPNIEASSSQIIEAAMAFSESANVNSEYYSLYTGDELSGAAEEGVAVRFSLMPDRFSKDLQYRGEVKEQLNRLQHLREQLPHLSFRIPSVLEAISYWYTLRVDNALYRSEQQAHIRHIDLAPKRFESRSQVPLSYIDDRGKGALVNSITSRGNPTRVMVG